jgi:hypothetical protein
LQVPQNSSYAGKLLRVKAYGRVSPGTTGNVTASIYCGSAATVAGGSQMATTGAVSCTTSCSFIIDSIVHWNDLSGSLLGYQTGIMGATPTLTTLAVNTSVITSDPTPTAPSTLYFIATILFGTTNASNTAYLDGFSIDVL